LNGRQAQLALQVIVKIADGDACHGGAPATRSMEDKARGIDGRRRFKNPQRPAPFVKSLSDRRHGIAAARANAGAVEFSGEVLDENVLSESLRPTPSAKVLNWMRSQLKTVVFMTTNTEPELVYGLVVARRTTRFFAIQADIRSAPGAKDMAVHHGRRTRPRGHCTRRPARASVI
jgi:hypothetical protein